MDRVFGKRMLGIVAVLPILLIHGYAEDAHIWDSWISWLKADHFNATAITFSNDDQCGTVVQHAAELANILRHYGKVNIVAHSAGGLVARWEITHNQDKVANLVMLGTPNQGTTAAYTDLTSCAGSAGLADLQPGSNATQAVDKTQTHYYAIAGNDSSPCFFIGGFRYTCYLEPNDGLVTVSSALSYYLSLGIWPYDHAGLVMHKDIYQRVLWEISK